MSKNTPCANSRTGCGGIVVQRGTIFCSECTENRKSTTQFKNETELSEIMSELIIIKDKHRELEKEKIKIKDYSSHLEKENERLTDYIKKLKIENETLMREKSNYEITQGQLEIDNKKLYMEVERLKSISNL